VDDTKTLTHVSFEAIKTELGAMADRKLQEAMALLCEGKLTPELAQQAHTEIKVIRMLTKRMDRSRKEKPNV
jgi:hypothetical protein